MKRYLVEIPIAGRMAIEVDATSKDAAKEAAWDKINAHEGDPEELGELEWEYLDIIAEGNCCHAPCNEVGVMEVRS